MNTDVWQGKARASIPFQEEEYTYWSFPVAGNEDKICIGHPAGSWTLYRPKYCYKRYGMPGLYRNPKSLLPPVPDRDNEESRPDEATAGTPESLLPPVPERDNEESCPDEAMAGTPESLLPPVPDRDNEESRPDEATVSTAPPGSHPAVDVNIHGKTFSGLVDTCAGVGIIASSIVRDLGLKTIPTKEYINGFDDAAPRTLVKEKVTAPLEYDGKTYWETLYVVENPFHSLILPCAMLLKSGLVEFANPVRYIIKKLKGVLPLAACKFKRRPRSIRTWFTRQLRQSPFEDEKRKEEKRKKKKHKQRELESNEEQRRQEEADELLDHMPDGAPKNQFRLEETNRRRAWQDSFDAGG